MRRLTSLLFLCTLVLACKKEHETATSVNASISHSSLTDGYLSAPYKVNAHAYEGPDRPYMLMEYINLQRAFSNLPSHNGEYRRAYYFTPTSSGGGASIPDIINVDVPFYYEIAQEIDITKMIDCFNSIPDLGAVCTVELLTDLPVNTSAKIIINYKEQYAGHCFLRIKKSNQGKHMTQNIGFYPKSAIKTIAARGGTPARFLNDNWHAYNGSLKMTITYTQLRNMLATIKNVYQGGTLYDIERFNCTDFALKVFNTVRGNDPITIQAMLVPGLTSQVKSNMPQGVYLELFRRMKSFQDDSFNITLSQTNLFTDVSNSPCK